MLLVGLTGGIGSGKSTVARMLEERGAVVLDADAFARDAVAPGTEGFGRVVAIFGDEVLTVDGDLDRAAIAQRVFRDEELREQLEAVVHPEVRRMIAEEIAAQVGSDRVVVVDSPLLIETGAYRDFPMVVVVAAAEGTRMQRLVDRGMDEADARARIATQMPLREKAKVAHVLLDNEGSQRELATQVQRLWEDLVEREASA